MVNVGLDEVSCKLRTLPNCMMVTSICLQDDIAICKTCAQPVTLEPHLQCTLTIHGREIPVRATNLYTAPQLLSPTQVHCMQGLVSSEAVLAKI